MAALAPIDQAIRSNPDDTVKRLERARVLNSYGLNDEASAEMERVSAAWPDVAWPKQRLFKLAEESGKSKVAAAAASEPEVEGQTYALLVGISSFKDPGINPLEYAHEDAKELTRLLESERAGHLPPENVVLLTNEDATTGAIRGAIEKHLKGKAGKNDTVVLFIASHGATFKVGDNNKGFIITYDTSAQDPSTSGIPMDDIRQLFQNELSKVRRLLLYVDVCHAGKIGQITPRYSDVNR